LKSYQVSQLFSCLVQAVCAEKIRKSRGFGVKKQGEERPAVGAKTRTSVVEAREIRAKKMKHLKAARI
jgi:hypothetical protein